VARAGGILPAMSPQVADPDETASAARRALERLRQLDACAVSDALDRLRQAHSARAAADAVPAPRIEVVSSLLPLSGAERIAGRALTVKLGAGPAPAGPARHLGAAAIEAGGPEHVIVIEQRSGIEAACWGGLLTLAAQIKGIAGVVADGLVRDLDQARAQGFAIHARGATPRTARGRIVELATHVPVMIDRAHVAPGDYVLADATGVVFVAAAAIEAVLAAAEEILAREAAMAAALRAGSGAAEVLSGAYEQLLHGSTRT